MPYIPEQLKGKEICLSSIGLNEVAWQYDDALLFINNCEKDSIFILGGDVLSMEDSKYRHTNDNWYLNTDRDAPKDSIKKAKDYVSNYLKGDYIFVFVTEKIASI